jgi:hypothetical protein
MIPFTPAGFGSVAVFVVIVFAIIAAFLAAIRHAYQSDPEAGRRALRISAFVLGLWLGMLSVLVASGRMSSLPLSGLPIFFGSVVVMSLLAGLSPLGGRIAAEVPLSALVGFQAFRLPLELVLHQWAGSGTIPETMTWTGQNWDIVSGVVALAAAPLANQHRALAWTANVIGSLLLLNVIRVALLSSPLPFAWKVQPPLLLALHLPYAWIGPVCVGGALAGHIVLTRALLRRVA